MKRRKLTLAAGRVNAGYTMKQVAEMLDVSPGAVYLWESGATKPRVERARKLAELYDMTLEEIYD